MKKTILLLFALFLLLRLPAAVSAPAQASTLSTGYIRTTGDQVYVWAAAGSSSLVLNVIPEANAILPYHEMTVINSMAWYHVALDDGSFGWVRGADLEACPAAGNADDHVCDFERRSDADHHWFRCTVCGACLFEETHVVACDAQSACYACGQTGIRSRVIEHTCQTFVHEYRDLHKQVCPITGEVLDYGLHMQDCTRPGVCIQCGSTAIADQLTQHSCTPEMTGSSTAHWSICPNLGGYADAPAAHTAICSDLYHCADCGYVSAQPLPYKHQCAPYRVTDSAAHWMCCPNTHEATTSREAHRANCDNRSICASCGYYADHLPVDHHCRPDVEHDETGHWQVCPNSHAQLTAIQSHAVACSDYRCQTCGYADENAAQLVHAWSPATDVGDQQFHSVTCQRCGSMLRQAHTAACTAPGRCADCGQALPANFAVAHRADAALAADPTLHWHTCLDCGAPLSAQAHTVYCAQPDVCAVCGSAVSAVYRQEAVHELIAMPLNAREHQLVCVVCGQAASTAPHEAVCSEPTACFSCGAENIIACQPLLHFTLEWHDGADGAYTVCMDCGIVEAIAHTHRRSCIGQLCEDCGKQVDDALPAAHRMTLVTGSGTSTGHVLVCADCGLRQTAAHQASCDAPGRCNDCGYEGAVAAVGHYCVPGSSVCVLCGKTHEHRFLCSTDTCLYCAAEAASVSSPIFIHDAKQLSYTATEQGHTLYCTACQTQIEAAQPHTYENAACTVCCYSDFTWRYVPGGAEITGRRSAAATIIIPDTLYGTPVVQISSASFAGDQALTAITIPASVTDIAPNAFYGAGLTQIDYLGTEAAWSSLRVASGNEPFLMAQVTIRTSDGRVLHRNGQSLSGRLGQQITWLLKDGVLTVSGTGCMDDALAAQVRSSKWASASALIRELVIEEGVGQLADGVFVQLPALTHASIASTVMQPGDALSGCTALAVVENASSAAVSLPVVSGRSWYILREGAGLTSVRSFSRSVAWALPQAAAANAVVLPASTSTVDAEAFAGIAARCVVVPASVASIGSRAFANCPRLEYVLLRSAATMLAQDALTGSDAQVLQPSR